MTITAPAPMLAKATAQIPAADSIPGGYGFEPKWDGFRCLVLCTDGKVELISRGNKPLTRYFPEVAAEVAKHLPDGCLVDTELVVRQGEAGQQRLDWDSLSQRIHPAESRINRLAAETPAELICFDLLAVGDQDITDQPFARRRELLVQLINSADSDSIHLTRLSRDAEEAAEWFSRFEGAGLDGVIAKPMDGLYLANKRAMLKIKHSRTAEVVLVGYRVHKSGQGVGSLLVGLYTSDGRLYNVGGISAFTVARRLELIEELADYVVTDSDGEAVRGETDRSRFSANSDTHFVALRPERVVEVKFDQLEGYRFRHAVGFLRWRPDRDPRSCTIDQIEQAPGYDLAKVLSG